MTATLLGYITWDADPNAFVVFGWPIKWYGISYALSFLVGYAILAPMFKREGKPEKDMDQLTLGVVLGILLGARLGQVFFYSNAQDEYWSKPWTILYVWEGGMASHGATLGIMVALLLYMRKHRDQSFLWLSDRLSVVVPFGAAMIRLGNLMNSEIVGRPSDAPWAFLFLRNHDPDYPSFDALGNAIPRHPVVLYEALVYFSLFIVMLILARKYRAKIPRGMFTGILFTVIFTARFFLEFLKTPQEEYAPIIPGLTTGQLLSIPFVLFGVGLLVWSARHRKKAPEPQPHA